MADSSSHDKRSALHELLRDDGWHLGEGTLDKIIALFSNLEPCSVEGIVSEHIRQARAMAIAYSICSTHGYLGLGPCPKCATLSAIEPGRFGQTPPFLDQDAEVVATTLSHGKPRGNYDPNESEEAKAARLAKVDAFVADCNGHPSSIKPGETPRTKALLDKKPGMWRDWSDSDFHELERLTKQLERELAEEHRDKAQLQYALEQSEARFAPSSATRRSFNLTPQQVDQLRTFAFGEGCTDQEEAMEVTIGWLDEHENGPGWYVWAAEYPEEGSLPLVTHAPTDGKAP